MASTWSSIMREVQLLKSKGFDFMSLCSKRVRDGSNTRFWLDVWKGDSPFCDVFPRIFALEQDKQMTVANKMAAHVSASFRRPVRGGIEQQQLSDLVTCMDSVSLNSMIGGCSISGDGSLQLKENSYKGLKTKQKRVQGSISLVDPAGGYEMVELFLNIEKKQIFKIVWMKIFEILFRDLVFLVISSAKNYLSEVVISIFFKHFDTDYTENSHVRSDSFTIRGLTVFIDIEFLPPKPPMSDAIDRTNVIFAFTLNPHRWN
ncbi:hypothetical protein Tco_0347863 [Tanacetum coccineum]